ncbi:hypothetical protein ACFVQ4_14190 [Streptomyces laurentii]|uniref:hypothetical protein n=1 Tax=Streptomyces laurentii TaxID=39478 RepID=UPI0036A63D14
MTFRAFPRTSAAFWTAPVWLGIVVFYFFYVLHLVDSRQEVVDGPLWAPQQVALALEYFYAFAYALAFGLAVWDGGRLKQDRVWELAPSRSRYRVAAHALAPAVAAGWAILLLPVLMRLAETRLAPTPAALPPLFMGLGIVVAYAVVGCALGHLAPRAIAAPLGAVAVFYVISKTSAYSPPLWPRHVSGQLSTSVAFGEQVSPVTVLVPFAFAAAVATAVAAWWTAGPRRVLFRAAAAAAALAVVIVSVRTASGWGLDGGPVSAGHAPARCVGAKPRVCMAETGGEIERLDAVRREITTTVHRLRSAGADVTVPDTVTDTLLYKRGVTRPRSTASAWWLPLTAQTAAGRGDDLTGLRHTVLRDLVAFPCSLPDSVAPTASGTAPAWVTARDAALLWAAEAVGTETSYLRERSSEYGQFKNKPELLTGIKERAAKGRSPSAVRERAAWFEEERARACRLAPKEPIIVQGPAS